MNAGEQEELWQVRMRELSGAIAVSALFQMFIGFSGKRNYFFFFTSIYMASVETQVNGIYLDKDER